MSNVKKAAAIASRLRQYIDAMKPRVPSQLIMTNKDYEILRDASFGKELTHFEGVVIRVKG